MGVADGGVVMASRGVPNPVIRRGLISTELMENDPVSREVFIAVGWGGSRI